MVASILASFRFPGRVQVNSQGGVFEVRPRVMGRHAHETYDVSTGVKQPRFLSLLIKTRTNHYNRKYQTKAAQGKDCTFCSSFLYSRIFLSNRSIEIGLTTSTANQAPCRVPPARVPALERTWLGHPHMGWDERALVERPTTNAAQSFIITDYRYLKGISLGS